MWHLGRPTWEDCSAEASTDVHDLGDICVAGEDVRVRLLRVAGQHSESEEVALWQVKAVGGNISPGRSGPWGTGAVLPGNGSWAERGLC